MVFFAAIMQPDQPFKQHDIWYAVNNTRVLLTPARRLETFGATMVNYHLVSELPDSVNRVRIREGRIEAQRPQIMTPSTYASSLLEGFGEEAEQYAEWLRHHESDLQILQYGFVIRKQEISEEIVSDSLVAVSERVCRRIEERGDPMAAVVVGVETPWEVCLLKLMFDVIRESAPGNVRDMQRHRLLDNMGGVPRAVRNEIEDEFSEAAQDPGRIKPLGRKLQKLGLFEEYEDRFYSLLKP